MQFVKMNKISTALLPFPKVLLVLQIFEKYTYWHLENVLHFKVQIPIVQVVLLKTISIF